MTQLGLFTGAPDPKLPAHAPDSETSREAAVLIRPAVNRLQETVLSALRRRGAYGATVFELVAELGRRKDTVAPRITELREMGLVVDSGVRRPPRPGARTRAIVWKEQT